jgi:hypothetical protein
MEVNMKICENCPYRLAPVTETEKDCHQRICVHKARLFDIDENDILEEEKRNNDDNQQSEE